MKVRAFFPCEKVVQRKHGLLDILGYGFRGITLKRKDDDEYAKATVDIFVDIFFSLGEEGEKTIEIKLYGPDGELLSETEPLNVNVKKGEAGINLRKNFELRARKNGSHSLKLIVSETEADDWPIKIKINDVS